MSGKREQALEAAARDALKLIDDMARFVRHMALQDYALFNTAPNDLRRALDLPPDKPAEPKPARIFIKLDGGLIQSIFTDQEGPASDVYSIDYDTEGTDENDPYLVNVPQPDGTEEKALGVAWGIFKEDRDCMADVVRQIEAHGERRE